MFGLTDLGSNETQILLALISFLTLLVPTINLVAIFIINQKSDKIHKDVQDVKDQVNGQLSNKLDAQTQQIQQSVMQSVEQSILNMAKSGGIPRPKQ